MDLEPENVHVMGSYGRVLAMAGEVEDSTKVLEDALHLAEERNEEQLIEQVCMLSIYIYVIYAWLISWLSLQKPKKYVASNVKTMI